MKRPLNNQTEEVAHLERELEECVKNGRVEVYRIVDRNDYQWSLVYWLRTLYWLLVGQRIAKKRLSDQARKDNER